MAFIGMVWQFMLDIIIFDGETSWQQLFGFFIIVSFSLIQVSKVFCYDDTLAEEEQKERNAE